VRGPSGLLGEAQALPSAGVRCVVGVVERGLMRAMARREEPVQVRVDRVDRVDRGMSPWSVELQHVC
jgi:hypothetical protein